MCLCVYLLSDETLVSPKSPLFRDKDDHLVFSWQWVFSNTGSDRICDTRCGCNYFSVSLVNLITQDLLFDECGRWDTKIKQMGFICFIWLFKLTPNLKWMLRQKYQNHHHKSTISTNTFTVCNSTTPKTLQTISYIIHFKNEISCSHRENTFKTLIEHNSVWASATNRPQVSAPLLWELCKHGGSVTEERGRTREEESKDNNKEGDQAVGADRMYF